MSTRELAIATALLVLVLAHSAGARTWYVAADGSGDAPTIAAAVDSSASGDVILVGPGTYSVATVLLKAGTSLISEAGPTGTFLRPGGAFPQAGIVSTRDNCVVSGFSISGDLQETIVVLGDYVDISNNIIMNSPASVAAIAVGGISASIYHNVCLGGGSGLYLVGDLGGGNIYNNIILNGIESGEICVGVQIHCNLINGSMSTCLYRFNNFSGDPLFCGPDNYYLHSDSPCAPGNHPDGIDCGLIGPLPVGCGSVSVEETTWGAVKALYRE